MKTRYDLIIGATLFWAQSLGITACAPETDGAADSSWVSQVDESPIVASAKTGASLGGVTLDADAVADLAIDAGTPTLRVHVRANVGLADVRPFVRESSPADGEVEVVWQDARNFDLVLRGAGLVKRALFGQRILMALDLAAAPGAMIAQLSIEPRLYGFRGQGPFAQAALTPVYVGGPDPLRYRVLLDTRGASVEVDAPAAVTPHPTKDTATVDLSFDTIVGLLEDGARIAFSTVFGTKTAQVGARVVSFELTSATEAEVLASTDVCEAWVFQCLGRVESEEISLCGTYLQVTGCLEADVCEVFGPQAFRLDAVEVPASIAAAQAAHAASASAPGFQWCQLSTLEAYALPECLATPGTMEAIVAEIFAGSWQEPAAVFEFGREVPADALTSLGFFGAACAAGGPELLAAIVAEFQGSQVIAWQYEEPTACHNCTSSRDLVILFYPDRGRIIVLEGGHGYDS
ncbi:MAG: hypothetical protein IPK13_14990 [Deltaproteobacteria bacterium]|nr:hypothetical protein [Deltaproteobacteria bacterium]